jgi:sugar lactone lactonase YvrE
MFTVSSKAQYFFYGKKPVFPLVAQTVFFAFVLAVTGCGGGGGGDNGNVTTMPPPPPPPPPAVAVPSISLVAGALGGGGNADGTPGRFNFPKSLAVDANGNLFVTEATNCRIRKVVGSTVSPFVDSAVCGQAGSPATLSLGANIALDAAGNIYASALNAPTLKILLDGTVKAIGAQAGGPITVDANGTVYASTTFDTSAILRMGTDGNFTILAGGSFPAPPGFADGLGANARFNFVKDAAGLATGSDGTIYVADIGNHAIRKVSPAGVVTTLAGSPANRGSTDGPLASAQFSEPSALTVDGSGNVYVIDQAKTVVRKISQGGVVTTLAGAPGAMGAVNGQGAAARFGSLSAIAADKSGNVFVADNTNSTIRQIKQDGAVTTLAGVLPQQGAVDGTGASARFSNPNNLVIDNAGNIYVADTGNKTIRKIDAQGIVTTLAGKAGVSGSQDGVGVSATFADPIGLAIDAQSTLYVGDRASAQIRRLSSSGDVKTFFTFPPVPFVIRGGAAFPAVNSLAVDGTGNFYLVYGFRGELRRVSSTGIESTIACPNACAATSVATDTLGNLFVATQNAIKRIAPDGSVTDVGAGTAFSSPQALAADRLGNVFVADTGNHVVRKVTPSGVVTIIAGKLGVGGASVGPLPGLLNSPKGIALDAAGNVYVTTEDAVVKFPQ